MSYKKHIDRVFQEKLKDFEVAPNPELWKKIQTELNQEDKNPKKVFPIWLRYASIAALLAILITIGSFVFDGSNVALTPNQNTVDTDPTNSSDIITIDKSNNVSETINNKKEKGDSNIVSIEENTSNSGSDKNNTSEIIKNNLKNTHKPQVADNQNNTNPSINNDAIDGRSEKNNNTAQTGISNQPKSNLNETNISKTTNSIADNKPNTVKTVPNSNSLTNNASRNNVGAASIIKNSLDSTPDSRIADNQNNTNTSINNDVIDRSPEKKTNTAQTAINGQPKSNLNETNISKTTNSVADNKPNTVENSSNSTINSNNNVSSYPDASNSIAQSKSSPELDKNAINYTLGKEKTQEAVALNAMKSDTPHNEKEENQKEGDSLVSESPSIEEAIAQAEEISEKEEEELVDRWQAYVSIAPVYYNSLGKGSHIDEQFVSNSKTGEVNTSYGVKVSYALNKKLSIRSGVSKLKLSYDTDNVILYETAGGAGNSNPVNPLRNIDLAPASQSLNALSADNLGIQQVSGLYNAAISQRLSYYEVPVELEYNIVNKRFAVNIIGGVSTFFLEGNEVYSEFEEYTTYIGEANNVNSVSFSTNLGIGFNYKFTEKFRFNLEPTFKYQLNGFENTSGNFRPYIIGVYTGFSYKF